MDRGECYNSNVTLRIDISEVGDRIEEALASAAAGEEVVLERDGTAVAKIETRRASQPGGLREGFAERERSGPRGPEALAEWEEFERDLNFAKAMLNRPVETGDPFARDFAYLREERDSEQYR